MKELQREKYQRHPATVNRESANKTEKRRKRFLRVYSVLYNCYGHLTLD